MPFEYQPYHNPYAASIADLMLESGRIRAQQAQQNGAIWGRAATGIGDAISGVAGAIGQQQQRAADPRVQLEKAQVADLTQRQTAAQQLDRLMAGDQLPAGDAGPRQQSYLDANGLYDIPKLTAALAQGGAGHLAPDLLKGAEGINDSILKHQQLQQQADQQHTILIGDMAHSALGLIKLGTPIDVALDSVAAPGLATQRFSPQEYDAIKTKLTALPPEQQQAALSALVDAAAKIAPTKVLSKDALEVDRYGRTTASNVVPEKPTEASIALDAAKGDSTAAGAIALLKPTPPGSPEEQYIRAVAKGDKPTADMLLKSIAATANAKRDPEAAAQLSALRSISQQAAQQRLDEADPTSSKNQAKYEQEYRTVLARGLSSRSGGLGLEDAKVQQANHLLALMDQGLDPKTGQYNIPKVQYEELALGLARLVSPGGQVGEGMKNDLIQATAAGDLKKVATYLTGTPFNGSTQDVFKMLRDSIERQGSVAMENREGEMRYLRGLAPTDLAESRRQALEANSLNPLRQSRVIQNDKTGERKIQVSTDGGKTWK